MTLIQPDNLAQLWPDMMRQSPSIVQLNCFVYAVHRALHVNIIILSTPAKTIEYKLHSICMRKHELYSKMCIDLDISDIEQIINVNK